MDDYDKSSEATYYGIIIYYCFQFKLICDFVI